LCAYNILSNSYVSVIAVIVGMLMMLLGVDAS